MSAEILSQPLEQAERRGPLSRGWTSIDTLHEFFSEALRSGECEWKLAGSPVSITPLDKNRDGQALLDALDSERVKEHIENAHTEPEELPDMVNEIHSQPGENVRFAVRDKDGTFLGVVNCAVLDEDIDELNPEMYSGVLGDTLATGEGAYYRRFDGVGDNTLICVKKGTENALVVETVNKWTQLLRNDGFLSANREYEKDIGLTLENMEEVVSSPVERAGRSPVLSTTFAFGIPTMIKVLEKAFQENGVAPEKMRFMFFVDSGIPNPQSLRVLARLGARMEGFCKIYNDDGTTRNRIVLTLTPKDVDGFLEYAKEQTDDGDFSLQTETWKR